MRKLGVILIMVISLTYCVAVPEEDGSTERVSIEVEVTEYQRDGVTYLVFQTSNGGVAVINHTKELLETDKLR